MSSQKTTPTNYNTDQLSLPLETEEVSTQKKNFRSKPVFVSYQTDQLMLPMDLSDWIPAHHVSRFIHEMIENMPDELFIKPYKGGGRSAYHPKMMVKILLYAYSQKVYSCRGIAKMLDENLPMIWLSAMQKPDFRTINRFRSGQMKSMIDTLFEEMILLLIENQYISMENYFLDGTKIEANANKYSFSWKKATMRFEAKLREKIKETLHHIQEIVEADEASMIEECLEAKKVSPEQLAQVETVLEKKMEQIEKDVAQEDRKERKAKRQKRSFVQKLAKSVSRDFIPRLVKYKQQMETYGDRNSFSKTDTDATFMRMKEDHMKNGQLKPGYNVQMATENQFVLFYTIHQRPTDTRCFIPHMEKLKGSRLPFPKKVIADAGYGSESNYVYATEEKMDYLIPYNTYLKEQKRRYKKDRFQPRNWTYIEEDDVYICPNDRRIRFKRYSTRTDSYGMKRDFKIYECEDCTDCPLKALCTKSKGNRQIHYNPVYEEMKAKAKNSLWSDENTPIYARRKVEVESAFGHIKGNRSFRRFSLRGIDKVHTEFGIVALAHNFLKMAGLAQTFSGNPLTMKERGEKNELFFSPRSYFRGLWDSPFLFNQFLSLRR
ncbi:IS1182 family transposase [Bacillus xiapuensis]|uniref:IS1182 family transposase n=1 Tax=Bacillus xiapuensis TaxID=2014075 RepID=UPI001E3F634B|nr:IS1182 family transposase [Bacillus xiapuensis]